jgi:plastocyanin
VEPPPQRTTTGAVSAPPPRRPPSDSSKTAEVTGKVTVSSGGPAWVFVEDVKGATPGAAVEIKQEDKQFSPRMIAVPSGTRVSFPNLDVVYHNVFSLTPGQTFDLGMQRAGDPVKARVMSKPGVVEIFCNLHSRMSATVLVTPGPLLTKVARDGSFKLENVPVGVRRLTAWAGGQALSTQTVEVGPGGATVQFTVNAPSEGKAHTTKTGQPYDSYED